MPGSHQLHRLAFKEIQGRAAVVVLVSDGAAGGLVVAIMMLAVVLLQVAAAATAAAAARALTPLARGPGPSGPLGCPCGALRCLSR